MASYIGSLSGTNLANTARSQLVRYRLRCEGFNSWGSEITRGDLSSLFNYKCDPPENKVMKRCFKCPCRSRWANVRVYDLIRGTKAKITVIRQ